MSDHGRLIVLEGIDGSGKETQSALLAKALGDAGQSVRQISFPDYENESSVLVRLYLSGELGQKPGDVNAFAASSFYAADRYISYHTQWRQDYLNGTVMVADRYTTSNAVHQMPKLGEDDWNDFLFWLMDYEYTKLALPRPDIVVYLDMEPAATRKLIDRRAGEDGRRPDIHESNTAYLRQCRDAARYAARFYGWKVVPCSSKGEPRPISDIAQDLLAVVNKELFAGK